MTPLIALLLFPVLVNSIVPPNFPVNSYYSTDGGTTGQCTVRQCLLAFGDLACTPGQYISGCGNDGTNQDMGQKGTCAACTGPPTNGKWPTTATAAYSQTTCPFECNTGYIISGTSCQASNCPTPVDDNAVNQFTTYPCTVQCKAGYYGSPTATSPKGTCQPCAAGKYSVQGGSCQNCDAGYYSAAASTSVASCIKCDAGTYSGTAGSTSCTACLAGYFGVTVGGTSSAAACTQCIEGTWSDGTTTTRTQCTSCPAGYYGTIKMGTSQQNACTECGPGKYGVNTGATVCSTCSAGTASSATTATTSSTCATCNAGFFSTTGQSTCSACPTGTYITTPSASACLTCSTAGLQPGKYLSGCGGSQTGTPQSCSNIS